MHATLIVVEGAKQGHIRLRLPTVIGRSNRAKIKVRAARVSRTHCKLYQQDNNLFVKDLDSSNGTFLNDHRITVPTRLVTDDLLRVGPVTFRVACDKKTPESIDDRDDGISLTSELAVENDAKADKDTPDTQPATNDFIASSSVSDDHDNKLGLEFADASHSANVSFGHDDDGSTIHIDEISGFLRDLQDDVQQFGESALRELPVEEEFHIDENELNDFFKNLNS